MGGKSVIIIGAGLAGLSAGCYCRMNGFDTHIFEHHDKPGGVAASWKRKGYLVDGGVHFLMDHRPGGPYYQVYSELGAAQGKSFPDLLTYLRFVDQSTGRCISIERDMDKVEQSLISLFPKDALVLKGLLEGVRKMQQSGIDSTGGFDKPPEMEGLMDRITSMWKMRSILRYFSGIYSKPACELARDIHDPFLQRVVQNLFLPEVPVYFVMMILATHGLGRLGLLDEGSLSFARSIERRYKDLGGQISYNCTVDEILVENHRANGVRLSDGSTHRADYIISAADGHSTIFSMLGGRYLDGGIRKRYENWKLCRPIVMINYGINMELLDVPPFTTLFPEHPLVVNNKPVEGFLTRVFNYGTSFAPRGKVLVQAEFESDWDYWYELQRNDRKAYDSEKERLSSLILEQLEYLYPGISSRVEMTDVATPYTTWRYTRNYQGAYMAWLFTPEVMMARIKRTLPGLDNFYMAGQWVIGGSVPGCLYSGRHAAQLLCRSENKLFTTL